MKKRFFSLMTALVMVVSFVGVLPAGAENNQNKASVSTKSDSNISVEATSSFGRMLESKLGSKVDEQQENSGNNIFSIEIKGKQAEVLFETVKNCTLIVGVYSEDGTQMIASGSTEVEAGMEEVTVDIEIEQMPEYFYIKGFLADTESFAPLCTAYESPNYTQEMQEFLAKTTDDFESDKVLNLDESKDNNFAVYNDDTVVIPESSNKNVITTADDSTLTYVIENIDSSISSLKNGDIFSYEYEDGQTIIVKIASISIDGTTATIKGENTDMDDVFDYVKIDSEASIDEAEIDTSTCDESVTYEEDEDSTAKSSVNSRRSANITSKSKISIKHNKVKGSVGLSVTTSCKYYKEKGTYYLELNIDYSLSVSVSMKAGIDKQFNLAKLSFRLLGIVKVSFTPAVEFKAEASIEAKGELKGSIGMQASGKTGLRNISKAPKLQTQINVKGKIYIGVCINPKLSIFDEHIASASVKGSAGVEFSGKPTGGENTASKRHTCKSCIDGDISFKIGCEFKVSFFNKDSLSLKKEYSSKIGDFYYSFDTNTFAFTACPNYTYRLTVTVKDGSGKAISGAKVNNSYTTGKDGKTSFFVKSGDQNITVSYNGKSLQKKISMDKKAQSIILKFYNSGSTANPSNPSNPSDINNNDFAQVSLGGYHSAAIKNDGSLWIWGNNEYGQIGTETNETNLWGESISTKPIKIMDNIKSISLGDDHSAAIKNDGSLWMWGYNGNGQLGNAITAADTVPIKIMDNIKSISLGSYYSAAIKNDGSLWMWGYNYYGQLGNGTNDVSYVPIKIMDNVKSVSLGYDHSAAIKNDGSLWMWGNNDNGPLGNGTIADSTVPIKIMDNVKSVSLGLWHSAAIKNDGSLWMWGWNYKGQLGNGTTANSSVPIKIMDNVKSVSLGYRHNAAIKEDGSLWMWGNNDNGQLGNGTTDDSKVPIKIMDNVKSVSLGHGHSAAIKNDGSLWMWGSNDYGQLGNGTTENSSVPVQVTMSAASGRKAARARTASRMASEKAEFSGLDKNAVYNLYAMKSKTADEPFGADNLLYISQYTSDNSGKLSVDYIPDEEYEDAEVFVVKYDKTDLSGASVKLSNLTYNGKEQYINPTVTLDGETLIEGVDYYLTGDYVAKDVGIYTFSVVGMGKYTGELEYTYKINSKPVPPAKPVQKTTAKIISKKTTRNASLVAKDKKAAQKAMKQAKIKKLTTKSNAKKKITVSWKKVSKAKGYEVQVATKKTFKKKKILLSKLTTKKKLTVKSKKLKSSKTYYVRVRAYTTYKNKNGKSVKVYSAWNKQIRKVKVK